MKTSQRIKPEPLLRKGPNVKNWYEKLVLAIAALVLLVALFLFWQAREDLPTDEPPVRIGELATTFSMEAPTPFVEVDGNWPEPTARDEEGLWLYQVFTPPILYIQVDEDGNRILTPVPPPVEEEIEIDDRPPFGVRLVAVDRELFRAQVNAIYERSRTDPTTATVVLRYLHARPGESNTERMRQGDENERLGVRLDNISLEEVRDERGGLERIFTVEIWDLREDRPVVLTDKERTFEPERVFTLVSTEDPDQTTQVRAIGDRFEMNEAEYLVLDLDRESETVTLVKESDELEESETETLRVDDRPLRDVEREDEEDPETDLDADELMDLFDF